VKQGKNRGFFSKLKKRGLKKSHGFVVDYFECFEMRLKIRFVRVREKIREEERKRGMNGDW
jgi:hypothetical protein